MDELGIPYMGSKRKLARKIVDFILSEHPEIDTVYDLFGGGGAISFEFLQRPRIKKVIYNDLNTGVCELLRKIQKDGVTPEFYRWVDRETFHKHKNDNNWFGGLVKTCWSFGNDQRTYLFSKENERLKRPLHEIVVNKCQKSINEFKELTRVEIPIELLNSETINERRLMVMRFVKNMLQRLQQLQQLQQLEQLEQLQQLEQLEQLDIKNKSYLEFKIFKKNSIIYLDPPYENTKHYQLKIDHDELYNYISSINIPVYLSSYNAPFKCVKEFEHRCTLSATKNNKVIERLYRND